MLLRDHKLRQQDEHCMHWTDTIMRSSCCQAQKLRLLLLPVSQGFTDFQCLPTGTADFSALDGLKTSSSSSSSSCTSVLQAAMMVPDLSTFVTTAQVGCCHQMDSIPFVSA